LKEALVLSFDGKGADVRSKVYAGTQQHIADNLPGTVAHTFESNEELLKVVKGHEFSKVIYTSAIPYDTAVILKGIGLVQILIGLREDLVDLSDVIIDPLVCKSEKFLVGPAYLLRPILEEVPVNEIAEIMEISEDLLLEEVDHNNAESDLLSIARLYQKLEWDSGFFGINVGYISCLRLTLNIERHIKKFIRKEKIDLLEYRCNCHDRESVVTSSQNGYLFVDMRLTFEQFLHKGREIEERKGYGIKRGVPDDIEKLKEIATGIYRHSRYYFDTNFNRDKVAEFYRNWIEKAIRGTFDDYAYVLYHNEKPVGFCAIKEMCRRAARIGLIGMSSQYSGKGLAEYLLNTTLQRLQKEAGISYVEVITQGRNYAAQRLYQKCGFITKATELWYHKWFR